MCGCHVVGGRVVVSGVFRSRRRWRTANRLKRDEGKYISFYLCVRCRPSGSGCPSKCEGVILNVYSDPMYMYDNDTYIR